MTRLFSAELRKVWHSRFFLLAFCVLLSTNLFLLWFGMGHAPGHISSSAYRKLNQQISGMSMEEMDDFLHEKRARAEGLSYIYQVLRLEAYNSGRKNKELRETYADAFEQYYDIYEAGGFLEYGKTLGQEYRFLNTTVLEFEQVNGYEEFLESIEEKARKLSSISIFADSESGYDMENIRVTEKAFRDMDGTSIQYYPQKGIMTALDFALTDVVTVFAMLLIATVLVRAERDNGLLALVRSTPAGRLNTAGAKLLALGASLAVVLACLYGVNLLYCGGLYGLGPLDRTIQSVPQLMRSTWKLTVGQYLICFFITKWLAAFICGVWVMLAMLFARRLFTGALGALALIGCNLFIRSVIPATSKWNVFKYANLVSLLRTNELLGGYHNLYWFDHPAPLLLVECLAAALFGVLFTLAFCFVFSRHYFTAAGRQKGRRLLRRKIPAFTTPMRQEAYKLLVMQGTALLLALFAGFQVYTAVTTESYIDADEIYYQYYMKPVEGPLTKESYDWLLEQQEEFRPVYQLNAALRSKRITPEQYQLMSQDYIHLQQKMDIFESVVYKTKMLKEKPRMELVYESGWLKLFDQSDTQDLSDTLLVSILCAICFSGLFAMEHQTGMRKVIGTTPLGRHYTVWCKLLLSFVVCILITGLSLLPRFWVVIRDYGLGAWFAPIYSIREYYNAPEIPLFLMVALQIVSRLAAVSCMACATLALSQRIGNIFGAMFASLLVFSLPPLLSISGLTGVKWFSTYPLFHICALFSTNLQGIGFMVLLIILVACYLCSDFLFENFK